METLKEKAEKLFRRIGSLKVSDEEIISLADVEAEDVGIIRVYLDVFNNNIKYETLP